MLESAHFLEVLSLVLMLSFLEFLLNIKDPDEPEVTLVYLDLTFAESIFNCLQIYK